MLGSRAPKPEIQVYTSEKETTPSGNHHRMLRNYNLSSIYKNKNTGMLARGKYAMKTQITDDDKKVYLTWEWNLEIAKDWK
jgi:hypothetical protein